MENTSTPDWYSTLIEWESEEEQLYFNNIRKKINWNKPEEINRLIKKNFIQHDEFRERKCLNLVASENMMSPLARKYLGSNLGFRVCDGPVGKKIFGSGIQFLEEIEAICIEASKRLFRANYVEHRLLSGTMGCMAIHYAFSKKGDVVMSQSSDTGGVVCNRPEGPSKYIGSQIIDVPWDKEAMTIDLDGFEEKVEKFTPKLIILGAMVTLFPYPMERISRISRDCGAVLAYDGAHIGGLMAGNRFQDPLNEGADLMMVNTHKQMGGPPGAMILSNEEQVARTISETTVPFLVATPYCNRFASLAVTLAELLQHGEKYAEQIVKNAKTLGSELDKRGLNVLCKKKGYTESHQLLLNIEQLDEDSDAEKKLADAYIICNKMPLPGDLSRQFNGLRLGVNEITRRGMKEDEMKHIADLIGQVLIDDRSPKSVSKEVKNLMAKFQTIKYTL